MNKRFKKLSLAIFFLSNPAFLSSQSDTIQNFEFSRNSVYVEFIGNLPFGVSMNYERSLRIGKGLYSIRGGIGRSPFENFHNASLLYFKRWIGKKEHHFEFGIGNTITFKNELIDRSFIFIPFGYRYQAKDGGFIFRLTYNPFLFLENKVGLQPLWGGISLGWSF